MINKVETGRRISALRKELGYSQAVLAEKLNVSTQAVSKWETGLTLPDIEVLLNISWICKVSINQLLEGEDFVMPQSGIDRKLLYINNHLICPKCHNTLKLSSPAKGERLSFTCSNEHRYEVIDGVIYFDSREIGGELWSLLFKDYEQYLEEQHCQGNPRYWTGNPHYREIMWQTIKRLHPRTIIDMACGMGTGIKYIIERIDWPVTIIMADLSHRILKWNKRFFSEECNNPYVDLIYLACDCATLPLENACMDIVFSNGGFESMQKKMMAGFTEGYRVLKPGGHAIYNISTVDDFAGKNTKKWLQIYSNLGSNYHEEKEIMKDIDQWLQRCKKIGYLKNESIKIYGELPAPTDDVFPFENEILQWMGQHVVISQK